MRDAAMSLVLLVAFTDLTVSSYTSCRHVQHRPSMPAAVMMVEQRRGGDGENSDDDELISYEDWDLAWKRHALGSIIEAYDVIEQNSDADETSCRDSAEAGRTAIREFLQTLQICSFATLLVWSYTIATGGLLLLPTQGAGVALYRLRDVADGDQLTQMLGVGSSSGVR